MPEFKDYVHKLWSEAIGGVKRFLQFPFTPEDRPSEDYHVVNKYWTIESDSCDKLVVSVSAHSDPTEGDIWIDTTRTAPVSSVTTDYTVLSTDVMVLANASGGAFSVALGAASDHAFGNVVVKKIDSSDNGVRLNPSGAETIDSETALWILEQYEDIHILSDGFEWHRIDAPICHHFVPMSAQIVYGTITTSFSVGDVTAFADGNYMTVEELGATPGFQVVFTFMNVNRPFDMVTCRTNYEGTATHIVGMEIYNFTDTAWDSLSLIPNTDGDMFHESVAFVPDSSDYISNGQVRVGVNHYTNGNAAHGIFIDYVGLKYRG